jgi:hypothetical protein
VCDFFLFFFLIFLETYNYIFLLIVEEMDGRWLGAYNRSIGLQKLHSMFHKNFQQPTQPYSGICLGIAGDTNPNVLWRLMNGEMPSDFHPKIWWISLGMNDLTRTQVRTSKKENQ